MNKQEAIGHIEALYPPDSEYADTREIGMWLMDDVVCSGTPYQNWRDLPEKDLIRLAEYNLAQAGEPVATCDTYEAAEKAANEIWQEMQQEFKDRPDFGAGAIMSESVIIFDQDGEVC